MTALVAEGRGEDDYSALATVLFGLVGLDDRIEADGGLTFAGRDQAAA